MKIKNFIVLMLSHIILSCAVIRPGEVGIKQRLGKFTGYGCFNFGESG